MSWPQPLNPVTGPFDDARLDGAAAGMGDHGPVTADLIRGGSLSPDLLCGMTLFLLTGQPRSPRRPTDDRASPIAGGVWVREQFTIHRVPDRTDPFIVGGESTGRFVRKGRQYGTTASRTHDSSGRLVATNLTNGLLSYRAVDGLADRSEGLPLDDTPRPEPDWEAAGANPHLDWIGSCAVDQRFGGDDVVVSLAMMAARDTENPTNPIHSDADAARAAGLQRPIAGGSHVLAFALEPLLAAWGPTALHHGARFDVRWRAPTEADTRIVPTASVNEVAADRVELTLAVDIVDGPTALVGELTVPLPR